MATEGASGHRAGRLARSEAFAVALFARGGQPTQETYAMEQVKKCRRCSRSLTYVRDFPYEDRSQRDAIGVSLASNIYRCPEHGLWRIFISGAAVPFQE